MNSSDPKLGIIRPNPPMFLPDGRINPEFERIFGPVKKVKPKRDAAAR